MKSHISIVSALVLACAMSACSSGSQCDDTKGKANADNSVLRSQTNPDGSPCEIAAIVGDVAADKSSEDVIFDHVKRVQAKDGVDKLVPLSAEDRRIELREQRVERDQRHKEEREQRELDSADEYME